MTDIRWLKDAYRAFSLAPPERPRPAAELMALARRKTGLQDFGAQPVEEALDRLLAACHGESDLSLFGRVSTHWDTQRLLQNLLILRDRELTDPSILDRPIERPIFVMGLPRSGTSFLHALLAEDETNIAPRCWQVLYPDPDHPAAGRGAGPNLVQRQFDFFNLLAPELRSLHPFNARSPQECTDITAHSFQSLRFEITYHVPSYRRWLSQRGHHEAYRFHRRFLQHLQGPTPADGAKRWVLKAPDHVFAMDALLAAYPDARVVFSHRDPLKVLPSVSRLTEILRRPFTRSVDRAAIGRQVTGDWARGADQIILAETERRWPADRVFHVHYKQLTSDPLGTIDRLYQQFDMELTPRFRDRLNGKLAENPDGGYGRNVYRFERFGLNAGEERERYGNYMTTFDVEEEVAVP